jgi:predicted metal-dependent hydrolase
MEPTHSDRFFELMDKHMPNWAQYKALLDEPPIMHVDWDY